MDLNSFLQIIFFVIILWFIVKSFILQKRQKGLSKDALLWFLIFAILIIIYAFRFELDSFKNKVLAVLLPSYSWTNENGELVIARNINGHFYLDAYTATGKKIHFLIDTGASDIALTKEDAIKLGFNPAKLKYTRQYSTANGITFAAPVRIPELKVGSKIFYNVEGHVTSGELDISLLGMSFIEDFRDFKITQDKLILSY